MPEPTDRNAFLAQLPAQDYELFRPHLSGFHFKVGERFESLGAAPDQVVFLHGGLVALTLPLRNGGGGGAILVGRDGVVGAFAAAAAAPAMCDADVYVAGRAARMPASAFRYALDHSPAARTIAARHNAALMFQAQRTALCNAAHPVEGRIARWLLEIQDRCGGSNVPLTQGRLADMLGVQRTTVNLAAGRLEMAGVIACRRGSMEVLRREWLEHRACECHRSVKACVARLFALPIAPGSAAPAKAAEAGRGGAAVLI